MHRYHRQMLLPGIGPEGQSRLLSSRAAIVGCGALGTVIADALARAGVGALTIIDRDVVELTNLQRQVLFDERDVRDGTPKAIAARQRLRRINSEITIDAHVADFNHTSAERLAAGANVLVDGLDNFQSRYLLNDLSVSQGIPYMYGGAVGTTGMACAFIPESCGRGIVTPCLRCVFPEAPPPGSSPTCDTAGVLGSAVAIIAHHESTQAIKLLSGNEDAVDTSLLSIDVWRNEMRRLDVSNARNARSCPCCGGGEFDFLEGRSGATATTLCGRGAVQILPRFDPGGAAADLETLATRLAPHGSFRAGPHLLRGQLERERGEENVPIELTVFPDGRAIIAGTASLETARGIYDRYIGG